MLVANISNTGLSGFSPRDEGLSHGSSIAIEQLLGDELSFKTVRPLCRPLDFRMWGVTTVGRGRAAIGAREDGEGPTRKSVSSWMAARVLSVPITTSSPSPKLRLKCRLSTSVQIVKLWDQSGYLFLQSLRSPKFQQTPLSDTRRCCTYDILGEMRRLFLSLKDKEESSG